MNPDRNVRVELADGTYRLSAPPVFTSMDGAEMGITSHGWRRTASIP
jgi:hypothetical protein